MSGKQPQNISGDKMSDLERIDIYVPAEVGFVLENDAELFEIFKPKEISINKNRYINLLIKGYFNDYYREYQDSSKMIFEMLAGSKMPDSEKKKVARNIVQEIVMPVYARKDGQNKVKISLKPINATENIIEKIRIEVGSDGSISKYIARMLSCYAQKPVYERERIIFKENYDFLLAACNNKHVVSFSTIWDKTKLHDVIPYDIVIGREEMFNYLLCGEIQADGIIAPMTYRLNRITGLDHSNKTGFLTPTVCEYLNKTRIAGPQYVISQMIESCVKLTTNGEKLYRRIYYGRPQYVRCEKNSNESLYYFNCSLNQLLLYFRRFGEDAVIVSPNELREQMSLFFSKANAAYK